MIQKNEVLLKSNNEWLHFASPQHIISAARIGDVRGAMQQVEKLVEKNNWHAAGFVSYEAAPAFDNALHVLSTGDFPLVWFGLYPKPLILKNSEVFAKRPAGKDLGVPDMLNWRIDVGRESYNSAVKEIKEYIAQGKTYQVNYTLRLNSDFNAKGWDFFLNLAQTQNKYAAYIDIGRFAICSASPELFFKLDGDKIYSQPMKGTFKRGRTTREDKEHAELLLNSAKNRAENVMIVI